MGDSIEERMARTEAVVDALREQHNDAVQRLAAIEKTVWVGVGILAVVQLFAAYYMKHL